MSRQFIQLLPKLDEARLLRKCINEFMLTNEHQMSIAEQDMCWKLLSDISTKLRDA